MPPYLDITKALFENPTAPLLEYLPQTHVRAFAAARPELKLTEDAAGNLRVDLVRGKRSRPPLALVAHLDHPGWHVKQVNDDIAELEFHGWHSGRNATPGTRIHFFELNRKDPVGTGELIEREPADERLKRASARIVEGRAAAGGFAMWAFPGFLLEGSMVSSRCVDDLGGAAAILCVLDELVRSNAAELCVTGLFTRAEEIGFLGTLEAIRLKTLPQDACVLSLECSKALPNTPQGAGAIVRVGDAASIFDPQLTGALTDAARKLAKSDPTFKFQRKLMDGGTCEATPFCAFGYRATGVCLPMGNYHNQDDSGPTPRVGPETIHADDLANEVKLLVELAKHPEALDPAADKIPPRIKELLPKARELLGAPN